MCILGVGPKPVTVLDTKAKSKNGGKGGPQPGDVGFFKLGLLSTPQNHNDGSKVISVKYDYCSFNSGEFCVYQIYITKSFYLDWAQKKELFIGMMLRAYRLVGLRLLRSQINMYSFYNGWS